MSNMYEVKPSIKLIYKTTKENLRYGDMSLLAYILIEVYHYSQLEIRSVTGWDKGHLSNCLKKGLEDIKNPIRFHQCNIYMSKIDEKFQLYIGSINKEFLTIKKY